MCVKIELDVYVHEAHLNLTYSSSENMLDVPLVCCLCKCLLFSTKAVLKKVQVADCCRCAQTARDAAALPQI